MKGNVIEVFCVFFVFFVCFFKHFNSLFGSLCFVDLGYEAERLFMALNELAQHQSLHPLIEVDGS